MAKSNTLSNSSIEFIVRFVNKGAKNDLSQFIIISLWIIKNATKTKCIIKGSFDFIIFSQNS